VQFDREKSNACWFVFNPRAQSLALMNDAGQTPVASLHVGGNGTASNSQCAIRNLKIVEQAGRALRVSLDIQFAKTFAGRRNLYARAKDPWNGDPAWQWLGSWDVR
jgi:hypothetical protein